MSRANDFLKETIAKAGETETQAFWIEYRRLAQLDKREAVVNGYRHMLRHAREMIAYWEARPDDLRAATQLQRYKNQRDRAIEWLTKYGYPEEE
jgi:hypothetical protein